MPWKETCAMDQKIQMIKLWKGDRYTECGYRKSVTHLPGLKCNLCTSLHIRLGNTCDLSFSTCRVSTGDRFAYNHDIQVPTCHPPSGGRFRYVMIL
jgi:hypothetical protein